MSTQALTVSIFVSKSICVCSPHFGGPRDFLDESGTANGASENALNNTYVDIETCPDDCIDANSAANAPKSTEKELRASDSMCYYCFDVLIQELRKKSHGASSNLTPYFVEALPNRNVECPLFVTWEKQSRTTRSNSSRSLHSAVESSNYELRGCIGSLTPKTLLYNLKEYAIFSALQDHRFHPVTLEEVSQLRVSVSLLIQYETCQNCYDWTVGTHGIIIKFSPPKADGSSKSRSSSGELSATFLPEVAAQQHWDQKKTVHQLLRKAGYKGSITDPLIQSVRCTRYQSSKCKVSFQEYVTLHLGLNSSADGDDDDGDSKHFIKDLIEGSASANGTKHNNDAATPNCCIM
jgi:AMME syndrome candidate gene 1 protein